MKNTKNPASKKHQQRQSPTSPLKIKDLNVSTSYSSSVSSSISNEAPRCCLRFLLSHHSSAVSKNATTKKPSSFFADKTPKSSPNVKLFRGKLSSDSDKLVKKNANLQNPEKSKSKNVQMLKKKPPTPCFYSRKYGRKPSSRLDLSDGGSNVYVSDITQYGPIEVGSDKGSKKCENAVGFSPVNETECGFDLDGKDLDSGDKCSPIPPIQASLSPEIQGGSKSVVKATPTTCYGAGHLLSGVTDKRKCRPRGLLTFGDNNDLFGSSKTKTFHSDDDEDVIDTSNKPRVSLVPCPVEASIHWNLSPCDEMRSKDMDDDDDDDVVSGVKLVEYNMSMPMKSVGCSSSPSSSLGFSSEISSKSNSAITVSDATTVSHGSRSRSSEFRGVQWPSFDHMVRNLSPPFPDNVVGVSPEHGKHPCSQERETTPCSIDSIGSKNVIQTPQSNTSSSNFGLSHLSRDEISRLWFECELNSVNEVLRRVSLSPDCELQTLDSSRTSFEFNPLIRIDNSIDLAMFRKVVDSQASLGEPEPILQNLPESEVRISWREGLASRIFEMDELDCCRCFSDEEDVADNSGDFEMNSDSNKVEGNASDPASEKDAKTTPLESSNGDGSADIDEDVSWKVCENHLFQV